MNSLVICSYMGLFLLRPACAVGKTKENQICNCRIWINSNAIRIHIWLHSSPLINCLSLIKFLKTTGRTVSKMWFIQYVINFPAIVDTSDVKIFQGRDMSWWKRENLIIFVGFLSCDVLDLEVLFLEVYWLNIEMLSSATPSILYDTTILQGRDMSWWQWATLVIYVGFQKLDGSDLEGLVLDVNLVISESLSSST